MQNAGGVLGQLTFHPFGLGTGEVGVATRR